MGAHGDHGLDGEHHAGLEHGAPSGVAEVRHLRLLVERPPDSVIHEGTHYPEAMALAMLLHGVGDVADAIAHAALHDGFVETLPRDVDELLHPGRHRAHGERHRAITVVAFYDTPEIEPDDVALLELPLGRRNTVDDFLVDRGAHRGRIPAVALEGRGGSSGQDEGLDLGVDLLGRHAGLDQPPEQGLDLGENSARRAHVLELTRRLEEDHRGAP